MRCDVKEVTCLPLKGLVEPSGGSFWAWCGLLGPAVVLGSFLVSCVPFSRTPNSKIVGASFPSPAVLHTNR